MWVEYPNNPCGKRVGDCAVRALSIAEDVPWYEVYDELCRYGREMCDMPNSNAVIAAYLKDRGYTRHAIEDRCPACYSIREFANDRPRGIYVVGTGSHVVAVINGDYYDMWDSGDEIPAYYWRAD